MFVDAFDIPAPSLRPGREYQWRKWGHSMSARWAILDQLWWVRALAREHPNLPRRGHYVYHGGLYLCWRPARKKS